jgi:hypothetical protein
MKLLGKKNLMLQIQEKCTEYDLDWKVRAGLMPLHMLITVLVLQAQAQNNSQLLGSNVEPSHAWSSMATWHWKATTTTTTTTTVLALHNLLSLTHYHYLKSQQLPPHHHLVYPCLDVGDQVTVGHL